MAKLKHSSQRALADARMDVSHLRRDARTALELAVVALAPWDIINRLASAAGLLEALGELPEDSAPAIALTPKVLARSKTALQDWQNWRAEHLEPKLPRG